MQHGEREREREREGKGVLVFTLFDRRTVTICTPKVYVKVGGREEEEL
jgi:hypothetical protein